MDTYVAPDDRRRKAAELRLIGDAVAFNRVRHPEVAPLEPDAGIEVRSLAVAFALSLALWGLIWFALTRLISNWP
jgi:hypothetical protein